MKIPQFYPNNINSVLEEDDRACVVENLLRTMIYGEIVKNKVIEHPIKEQPKALSADLYLFREDLKKSYDLFVDDNCLIYLGSIKNYISDKKDALVLSAWISFAIKQLYLMNTNIEVSNHLTIQLFKAIPLPSKEMLIALWSSSIDTYCFNKLEYKHSLHYHTYIITP